MGKTLKKYLLFDLDTTALKEEFGPKRYTVVYSMIRQFLENCGFEHKQGSGYLSTEPISLNQTIAIYQAMTEEMPWLDSCSKTMDVGNVRRFYTALAARHRNRDPCRQVEGVCQARHARLVLSRSHLFRPQAL